MTNACVRLMTSQCRRMAGPDTPQLDARTVFAEDQSGRESNALPRHGRMQESEVASRRQLNQFVGLKSREPPSNAEVVRRVENPEQNVAAASRLLR